MRTINLPPYAPTLMESTRAIGYSLEAAIADIIDNSITAQASTINIKFFPVGQPYISILDNGEGMTGDELNVAMQYGSKNPNEERDSNDLGRFGLGLKTASLSQCRKLTVISLKNGELSGRRWDIDYVLQTGEWSLIILEDDEIKQMPQFSELSTYGNGTIVVWQNLDRLIIGEIDFVTSFGLKMDIVREHLSLVFHRFLSGEQGLKKIDIFINNNNVKATDPFLAKKSIQLMDDESIIIREQSVIVRPYILPHTSKLSESEIKELGGKDGLRRKQGFYVYRNKRLLVWATWFRLMRQGELSKLARVQVDIPNSLDDLWALDIKKSTAIPPEEIRKNLGNIIEKISEGSKRTWTYRGKKETDDSKIHIWNRIRTRQNGIIYRINRDYPLLEKLQVISVEAKQLLEQLLLQIEGNLPLNSLYVDLISDERVENEVKISEDATIDILTQLLSGCRNNFEREELLERLVVTEPFLEYKEVINCKFKGAKQNE
ncbi:ATP-binding protein [Clostridium magnum]|uniref:DNA mismatch repair protein MutL n=1 Tax=Clostridium magnum DSM 2767 TaxID=1121326 RepID=A0A162UI50_9CLOT|nr:ATP-binding protein [Clostridium magnum]KZL93935.1 DNA mismatch repair protein MutL [Clostridium magnum DSM 2767]SHH98893.1 Histidine kinase-, DNA gyrase B-, and HSP90-like ATPase [Clostridium magnum DSM 2767]